MFLQWRGPTTCTSWSIICDLCCKNSHFADLLRNPQSRFIWMQAGTMWICDGRCYGVDINNSNLNLEVALDMCPCQGFFHLSFTLVLSWKTLNRLLSWLSAYLLWKNVHKSKQTQNNTSKLLHSWMTKTRRESWGLRRLKPINKLFASSLSEMNFFVYFEKWLE